MDFWLSIHSFTPVKSFESMWQIFTIRSINNLLLIILDAEYCFKSSHFKSLFSGFNSLVEDFELNISALSELLYQISTETHNFRTRKGMHLSSPTILLSLYLTAEWFFQTTLEYLQNSKFLSYKIVLESYVWCWDLFPYLPVILSYHC